MTSEHDRGLNAAVAAVLCERKVTLGLTMDEVAERSGIPKVSVQRFLTAHRAITLESLDRLCRALSISPLDTLDRARRADPALVDRIVDRVSEASSGTAPPARVTSLT